MSAGAQDDTRATYVTKKTLAMRALLSSSSSLAMGKSGPIITRTKERPKFLEQIQFFIRIASTEQKIKSPNFISSHPNPIPRF